MFSKYGRRSIFLESVMSDRSCNSRSVINGTVSPSSRGDSTPYSTRTDLCCELFSMAEVATMQNDWRLI